MSVKVAVRVRPFNKREEELKSQVCISMSGNTTKINTPKGATSNSKSQYTFDNSFWSFDNFETQSDGYLKPLNQKYADQKYVFETLGQPLLNNAWEGYHCCLFAYGQTGSGKSYSMIGYGANKGIVPIACQQMFKRLEGKKAGQDYEVTVSMIQIYNQKVQDLLVDVKKRSEAGLQIRQNNVLGVYVQNATKTFVSDYKSIQALMEEGSKNRTIASTQMNATSSRAHTIISITFTQHKFVANKKTSKISVINLVDLAGSERQTKTGATGNRLKQAAGINLSLTTLGQVISALAEKEESKKKDFFVPYRNSALTRILQNALGGNSKTCMICALSPATDNFEETLSTLRYADQAKKIKNVAVVNETQTDRIIKGLKQQNQRLKALLQQKQKMFAQWQQNFKQYQNSNPNTKPTEEKKLTEEQKNVKILDKNQSHKKQELREQNTNQKNVEANKKQDKNNDFSKLLQIDDDLANGFLNFINHETSALNGITVDLQRKKSQQKKMTAEQIHDQQKYIEEIIRQMTLLSDEKINQEQKTVNKIAQVQNKLINDQQQKNENNQAALYMSSFGLKSLFQKKEKNPKSQFLIPPFLENISKDIMTNRKIKIFLAKKSVMVGKSGAYPVADIVLSGRDVQPIHAEFVIQNGRVFLTPYNFRCLVYRNGKAIMSKIQLNHLDRIVFGWNSLYLFKMVDDKNFNEKIKQKQIDWDFYREEMKPEQDIDQSDTETGGDSCCLLF